MVETVCSSMYTTGEIVEVCSGEPKPEGDVPSGIFLCRREFLLQQIWGYDYDGFDRTIDTHVTPCAKTRQSQRENRDRLGRRLPLCAISAMLKASLTESKSHITPRITMSVYLSYHL